MCAQALDLDIVLVADPIRDYLNITTGEYKAVIISVSVVV